MVHAARRALREHDGEDVEAAVRIGVEEVADGGAIQGLIGLIGDRRGVVEQGAHGWRDGFSPRPVVAERLIVEDRRRGRDQRVEGLGHRGRR